jgi:hypothetical protein
MRKSISLLMLSLVACGGARAHPVSEATGEGEV